MPINTHLVYPLTEGCPKQFLEWIDYKHSLTDKLRAVSGDAQIELLAQQWTRTDSWSRNFLNIRDKSVFQRDIIMKSHNKPYWYARTIIPQQCYDLDTVFFNRLRKESIRNLIFESESVKRINLINYPVNNQCVEFFWVRKYIATVTGVLWVRIAEFLFMEKAFFYLVEVMLPDLGDIVP